MGTVILALIIGACTAGLTDGSSTTFFVSFALTVFFSIIMDEQFQGGPYLPDTLQEIKNSPGSDPKS